MWYKKHKNATAYVQLQIVGMLNTVQLILDLKPNTQYEVKARMYSNAGIGPFSEPLVVKTDVGEFISLFTFYFNSLLLIVPSEM